MVTIRTSQHPRYSWEATWKEGGVSKRKFFVSRTAAADWRARKLEDLAHMAPGDAPLSAGEWAAVLAARRGGIDLESAVRAALASGANRPQLSLGQLVEMRLEVARQGRRKSRYLASLESVFAQLLQLAGNDCAANAVDIGILSRLIFREGTAAASAVRWRAVLHGLFELGVSRQLLAVNPVKSIPPVSSDRDGEVGILTISEAQHLWSVCADVAPVMLPALGLGLWAGLRPAEIAGLHWRDLRAGTGMVYVGGRLAKTRQRRLVRIELPLQLALEHRNGAVGPVWPSNGRRIWDEVRSAAGWDAGRAGDASGRGKPWHHNALRHSFVSYHLAHFGDAGRTALEAGHSQTVLFRHYRELVTPGDSAAWWSGWIIG